jgi:signal transduction histidine kinase
MSAGSHRHPLAPRSWLRLPRRTARLRLTLLYGGLFLACGAALLAITYELVRAVPRDVPRVVTYPHGREHTGPPRAGASAAQLIQIPDGPIRQAALEQKQIDLNHQLIWSAVALGVMALVSVALGYYVAGRVLRPMQTITRTARAISARNLAERLALDGPDDEFKELGDTLDELFSRLQAAFESQRHFVANASHELRTPLTVERSLLQVALADPNPTVRSLLATCRNALNASEQQQHLIEGLLTLATSESGLDHTEPVDLADITARVLLTPWSDVDRLDLRVNTTLQAALTEGDPRLLERLISNLIENAIRHNSPRGRVEITTGTHQQSAYLTITNTGPIIPPDELQRLFQPFQRLNGARTQHKHGHGLGLSIVQAIATAHGATLTADPRPDGGLTVELGFTATSLDFQTRQTDDAADVVTGRVTAGPGRGRKWS